MRDGIPPPPVRRPVPPDPKRTPRPRGRGRFITRLAQAVRFRGLDRREAHVILATVASFAGLDADAHDRLFDTLDRLLTGERPIRYPHDLPERIAGEALRVERCTPGGIRAALDRDAVRVPYYADKPDRLRVYLAVLLAGTLSRGPFPFASTRYGRLLGCDGKTADRLLKRLASDGVLVIEDRGRRAVRGKCSSRSASYRLGPSFPTLNGGSVAVLSCSSAFLQEEHGDLADPAPPRGP